MGLALADGKTKQALFRAVERAAAAKIAAETMQTLTQWFDASGRTGSCASLSEFIVKFGDPRLQDQLAALEGSLYGKQQARWSGRILARQFAAAWKKIPPPPSPSGQPRRTRTTESIDIPVYCCTYRTKYIAAMP